MSPNDMSSHVDSSPRIIQNARISNARLPNDSFDKPMDVIIRDGLIHAVLDPAQAKDYNTPTDEDTIDAEGQLLAPSLCHPHIHLDKAFILSHPRYRHLRVEKGTFQEAMDLTSAAKKDFTHEDLLQRGQRVIDESARAGVTHMRAFVEVDHIVGLKCLEAGVELKRRARREEKCHVQLCAFAQLPLHPLSEEGREIRELIQQAMEGKYEVDVVGSTPYVEKDRESALANVKWMIDLALRHKKHLDFHLDYNVDPDTEPLIFEVVRALHEAEWTEKANKCIVLGHCTRLIYFSDSQWRDLRSAIGDLPVSFVGLPTSDLYMMKSTTADKTSTELRTTLPVPQMITEHKLNAAIGINNIGNAFTPQGSCDPLYLANLGVGIYQDGTVEGARLLYECVSTRARAAIGLASRKDTRAHDVSAQCTSGRKADLLLFHRSPTSFEDENTVEDKVYYYSAAPRTALWIEA